MSTKPLAMRLLVFCALLTSCTSITPSPARDTSAVREIEAILQQGARETAADHTRPPEDVMDAMLPPLVDAGAASTERFDIAVSDIAARDFFLGLVRDSDVNIVVHPDVAGTISLDLQDVTVDEVMTIVREVYGYPWRRNGRIYQVMPAGLRTEIFKVNYLNINRRGLSETQVRAGQVTDAGESSTGSRIDDDQSIRDENQGRSSRSGVIGTRIQTSAEADFWEELLLTLQMIIGDREDRQVVVTPQAGMVVVRAMPAELEAVADYLDKAELTMQRQVILEAKILEVQLKDSFQSGIDWVAINENSDSLFTIGQGAADLETVNEVNGVFGLTYDSDDFSALIELLRTQGNVQVLSSPRISTVNNQKAVIKVGTDEFFVTEVSTVSTTSAGATTTSPSIELTPFFSGIALDVTPQISDDDEIILHVHPSVSEVEDQNKRITFGDEVLDLPLALSTIRESDSVIYAKSGQLVVIGGLMQNSAKDVNAGPPVLGELPGVGYLFRQTRQASVKSELVILLRPVVTSDDAWREAIDDSARLMSGFRDQLEPGRKAP